MFQDEKKIHIFFKQTQRSAVKYNKKILCVFNQQYHIYSFSIPYRVLILQNKVPTDFNIRILYMVCVFLRNCLEYHINFKKKKRNTIKWPV